MSHDWRDSHAQTQYRAASSSENKDAQQVSHQHSIEVAKEIDDTISGPTAVQNQDATNDSNNLRMKDTATNQKKDRQNDAAILSKSESGEALTKQEEDRADNGAEKVMECDFTASYKQGAKEFYKDLNTQSGKTVWDDRKSY